MKKPFINFYLLPKTLKASMIIPVNCWCFIALFAIHFSGTSQNSNVNPDTLNNWVSQNIENATDTSGLFAKSHEALELSINANDPEAINSARRNLSGYHERFGKIDSSIYYLELVLASHTALKDTASMAITYLEIQDLYSTKADYVRAANQVYAALALYENIGDKLGIAKCYVDLCDLLYYEDKYQESIDYCDKAIEIQREANALEDLAKSLRFKAGSQLFSGDDLEDALATINESIGLYEAMEGKEVALMASRNGRGNILKYMGRYTEAIADYEANYYKSLEIGFEPYIIPSIGNIGHVYKMQGKYDEALPYILQSIDLIRQSDDRKNLWENYMHARDIYEKLGDFEKAFEYSKLFSDSYGQYLQTIIDRLESEAQIKYETKQKEEQIDLQKTKIQQQQKIQFLYISVAVLLLISFIGMLHSRNKIRKKQKEITLSKEKLEESLQYLKSTQAQLIQSEKMASLGDLTAGIAHEIQNPLNFVNNFSEVSAELIDEVISDLAAVKTRFIASPRDTASPGSSTSLRSTDSPGPTDSPGSESPPSTPSPDNPDHLSEASATLADIKQNLEKITHHGKRADAIVKGMLAHSRSGKGEKELTDLNALAEEYLKLSYHGLRAKDKTFNADFKTDFDPDLPKVNVVPQDIGRVLLNLINNAFQAVSMGGIENPSIIVSTSRAATPSGVGGRGQAIKITVSDNGPGIPDAIKDKIFQPFFTTKPTGQGTGLGLSLSYDIVKAHGGEITVNSREGSYTAFTVQLHLSN